MSNSERVVRPGMWVAVWSFLLLSLVLGCSCSSSEAERTSTSPTCTVSKELVAAKRACTADDQCLCGTHCEYGQCVASCQSDDECRNGESCNRFGECGTADPHRTVGVARPQRDIEGLQMNVERLRVEDRQSSTVFVRSKGAGQARVVADKEVQVRCNADGDFAAECFAEVTEAGAPVQVRLREDVTEEELEKRRYSTVRVFPKRGGARLLSVQLTEDDGLMPFDAVSLGGQYSGTATLVSLGGLDGETLTSGALGAQVVVDIYPGAEEQIFRLRDRNGVMVAGGELIGRLRRNSSGAPVLDFPPVLHLSRGTSGPDAVEVVAFPQAEGVELTKEGWTMDLVLGLSGLTSSDTPRQRWYVALTRVSDAARGTTPTLPAGRTVELPSSRADVPFALEALGGPVDLTDDDSPEAATILALCGARSLSLATASPLSGDVSCVDGTASYFGLPYVQSGIVTREELLSACMSELSAAGEGSSSGGTQCVDAGAALWAITSGAKLPGTALASSAEQAALLHSQRVLSQWVGLGQFVATQAQEDFRFKSLVTDGELRNRSAYLQAAYDGVEAAWTPFWWVLTPRWGQLLFSVLPPEALARPDYTGEQREALSVPLAVTMLDALRGQLSLLALALEAEHFGGGEVPELSRQMTRRVLLARTVAHALWARTATADNLDATARADWTRASRELDRVWEALVARLRAMADGKNPLGVEEADLPLYVTTNDEGAQRRAFATSDYLLDLAAGTLSAAHSAYDRARASYDAQLTADFTNLNQAVEATRRRSQIVTRQAERVQTLCGYTVSQARELLEDGGELDATSCFLSDGCDFTPPSPVGEPEVYYEACRLLQLRNSRSSAHGFMVDDAERQRELNAFFDSVVASLPKDGTGQLRYRAAAAQALQVSSRGGAFILSFGEASVEVTLDELSGLTIVVPDASPIGLPTIQDSSSIESFRPTDVAQLNVMKPFGDADQVCNQERDTRFGGSSGQRQIPEDLDRAECYRGTLGEAALSTRRAQTDLEAAKARLEEFMQNYEISVQQCLFDDAAGELTAASQERFDEDTQGLRDAVTAMKVVSQIAGGVASAAGPVAGGVKAVKGKFSKKANSSGESAEPPPAGSMAISSAVKQVEDKKKPDIGGKVEAIAGKIGNVADLAGGVMQGFIDAEQSKHDQRLAAIADDATKRKCMNEAQKNLVGMDTARLEIVAATQSMGMALLRLVNLQREAENAVAGTADALADEDRAGLPRLAGSPWLSQDLQEYERNFRVAKRMVYLAVRAAEWESQQTLGGQRVDVLSARTPDELDAVQGAIQRAQATRTIPGGSSVGNQYVVVSLREQLLRKLDDVSAPEHELRLTAVDALRKALTSPRYAVYDGSTYLGQRIPFELAAPDAAIRGIGVGGEAFSGNNCAERLWSVTLGIEGDAGVSGESSLTSAELLKHNSFHSQWCTTEGRSGYQSASVAPGRNLFLDPIYDSELVASFDAPSNSEYTRATFSAVRTNVTRDEFEAQAFDQGRQSGLAGRGLFGQYALFFPANALRYERCGAASCTLENSSGLDLGRVNDVFLRFEYVAWAR